MSIVLELPMKAASFYSDSTDVLCWIRGRSRDFRPFVANRIGEIQVNIEPGQWQHVSTDKNPADLSSEEQVQLSLLNPNYGGVAQIG